MPEKWSKLFHGIAWCLTEEDYFTSFNFSCLFQLPKMGIFYNKVDMATH